MLADIKLMFNQLFNRHDKNDLITTMTRELFSAKRDLLYAENAKEHAELAISMNKNRIARLEKTIVTEVNSKDLTKVN